MAENKITECKCAVAQRKGSIEPKGGNGRRGR